MAQCVGTTAKGTRCRMGGTHRCTTCQATLCSNHVVWRRDADGKYLGPHCPWCNVVLEFRYVDGWGPWGGGRLRSVGRGLYQLGEAGREELKARST